MSERARHAADRAERTLRASGGLAPVSGERLARPARRARDQAGYERWLGDVTERLDPVMAWLGVLFALLAVFAVADPRLSPGWNRVLSVVMWGIWGLFALDFLARAVAAPSALTFARRHWLALVMLLVPTLRILRFAALARLGRAFPAARVLSSSYRARSGARRLVASRTRYLTAIAALAILAVAELGWVFELDHHTFASFGDALLWAFATVVAMQGDPVPASAAGKLVMNAGFVVGLVLVATLAGTFGSYLVSAANRT